MKAHWQVPDSRPLADFAPTIILKAKDFATEITIHNARTNQMGTEPEISREHVTNNAAVRQTLLSRGIRPESLPELLRFCALLIEYPRTRLLLTYLSFV